jgi:eukaryotic-like serine/threonine-protein kinase
MTSLPSSTCTTCGGAVDTTLLAGVCPRCLLGDVMAGPKREGGADFDGHELLGEIARGGMGVVYRARQLEPERIVALKALRSASLDSPEAMARFRNEAEVMVTLDHAAILPVYRCGEVDGIPFFTMKLVEGGSLGDAIGRYTGQWCEIAELMAMVCDGVRHAHERGVLHRDLKPGNILFDSAGKPYVSDFGIAKLTDSQNPALTLTSSMMGTPHYLAPEVAAGSAKSASVSSDVWSLGVVLYELLTGEKPFRGESVTQVLRALEFEQPIAPRKLRADVPRDLEVITLKALAHDPGRRYSSARALAADLRAWMENRPIAARAISMHERAWLWARRNPLQAGTAALLLLTVFAAAASLVWGYVRVKQENVRVVASEANGRVRLRESLLHQARAGRLAHEMGWRATGLKALSEAYAIRAGDDARDEAIAHLAGFDLELGGRRFDGNAFPSRSMELYAQVEADRRISVRRMENDAVLLSVPRLPSMRFPHVEFDPRGRWLAVSVDEEARVYSLRDHRELARWL